MKTLLLLFVLAQGGQLPPGAPSVQKPATAAQGAQQPGQPQAEAVSQQQGAQAVQPRASQQGQPPQGRRTPPPGGGGWQMLIFLGIMVLVFWLLIIRPQRKQQKKQEEFLASLKPGDRVVTSGGVVGRISSMEGNLVTLEVAKDVKIRMLKQHVAGRYKDQVEANQKKK